MAAADELNKAGHSVTVFERDDRPGGLLMYGIPNMKLEKETIERRVKLLEEEGITFTCNTEVGVDISREKLQEEYDAVILCTGAQQPRDLPVKDRDSKGIHFAMDYLTDATKSLNNDEEPTITAEGKDVIVIGGGDTGADCVATALRQKCKSVVQFGKHPELPQDRASDNPWPHTPMTFSLEYGYEEAFKQTKKDPREYEIMTQSFNTTSEGNVKSLKTIQVRKEKVDGRIITKDLPGTEKEWPAQLVLIAIGFTDLSVKYLNTSTSKRQNEVWFGRSLLLIRRVLKASLQQAMRGVDKASSSGLSVKEGKRHQK